MMRPDTKVEKVYLYPKPVDFRKSIDGLAAPVELDIQVAVFDPGKRPGITPCQQVSNCAAAAR
ncbi:hypothetical protein ACFSKY_19395 [Azotobacter chroococcum]|uniref:hypothetical protein n=1 Tax=Azotobacter chroococcum TaxID=353 RepID=UPI0035ED2A74